MPQQQQGIVVLGFIHLVSQHHAFKVRPHLQTEIIPVTVITRTLSSLVAILQIVPFGKGIGKGIAWLLAQPSHLVVSRAASASIMKGAGGRKLCVLLTA